MVLANWVEESRLLGQCMLMVDLPIFVRELNKTCDYLLFFLFGFVTRADVDMIVIVLMLMGVRRVHM